MTTTNLNGLANDPVPTSNPFGGILLGGALGRQPTGGTTTPTTGSTVGANVKKTTTDTAAPCPVNCREEVTPITYYLSTQPSPGSTPIRGQQKKVICDTPPTGKPSIPCEELNNALNTMGGGGTGARQATDSTGNPIMRYTDQFALNDIFSAGAFYPEFL